MSDAPRGFALRVSRRSIQVVRDTRNRFLAEVTAIQNENEQPVRRARKPSDDQARRVLLKASQEFWKPLMSIYADLDLSPVRGRRAIDALSAGGLVRLRKIPRVGRGGQHTVCEVLADADPVLREAGIERPKRKLGGSWLHNLYGVYVAKWAKREGFDGIEFERTLGTKQFDLVFSNGAGELSGVEICLTGSDERTALQLKDALSNNGVRVLAVFDNRSLLNDTQEILRKTVPRSSLERLQMRLIGELVSRVLEGV